MIKHMVMWKLKNEALGLTKAENALKIKEMLESLKGEIKEIISIEVGIDCTDNSNNYDVILVSEFKTLDDLNSYQIHPKHVECGQFIKQVYESRVCVDYKA